MSFTSSIGSRVVQFVEKSNLWNDNIVKIFEYHDMYIYLDKTNCKDNSSLEREKRKKCLVKW